MKQNELKSLIRYDAETGSFEWIKPRNGVKNFPEAGSVHKVYGYRYITVNQTRHMAHRLAWLYVHGEMPAECIDHINGDRADNRIANLRTATKGQNAQNIKGPTAKSTTGCLGAYQDKRDGRWFSTIQVRGKPKYLGRFASADLAAQAYLQAKRELHDFNTL